MQRQNKIIKKRLSRFATAMATGLALVLGQAQFSNQSLASETPQKQQRADVAFGEYALKAAFLYNFAKFTQWPAESFQNTNGSMVVCVLGKDPFGAALDMIAGKRVKDHDVLVTRIAAVDKSSDCHVVFISASEKPRLAGILDQLAKRPVLTITDMSGVSHGRGMINLKTVAEKIHFSIDTNAAQDSGLSFSSKLLALAEAYSTQVRPILTGAGPAPGPVKDD